MRITLDEWIKLQKNLSGQPILPDEIATGLPRVVHIGVLDDNGIVEIHMRLIAEYFNKPIEYFLDGEEDI